MNDDAVLITGGAGYIGSHVCKALHAIHRPLVIIDNLSSGHKWALPKSASFYECEISDTERVSKIIKNHRVTSVIHMAASVDVNESVVNPIKYYNNNVANAIQFLKACVESQVQNFVFSSTAAVYGIPKQLPVAESAELNPESPYGHSKMIFENILTQVAGKYGMTYGILRYFNVAGAALDGSLGQVSQNATHLIKVACETACGLRPSMKVFGSDYATRDGTAERDFIHVEDLADVHLKLLDYLQAHQKSDVFNCGYGKGFTVREIVETIKKVSKHNFVVETALRREGDVESVVADVQKLSSVLSWTPKYNDILTICRTAYLWELSRKNNLQS